jgi:hypothetical protein
LEVDATTARTRNMNTRRTAESASIADQVPTGVGATTVHMASMSTDTEKAACIVAHHPMEADATTVLTEPTSTNCIGSASIGKNRGVSYRMGGLVLTVDFAL